MGAFICVLTGFYVVGKGIYPLDINVREREIWGVLKGYGYNGYGGRTGVKNILINCKIGIDIGGGWWYNVYVS